MSRVLVRVHDVGKAFRFVRAVDGVSFDVREGEVFALLGPNGAGKSTLVRMMIGLLRPDQGAIQWFDAHGASVTFNPQQIGYLPEDRGLYRDQKVQSILQYFGMLRGMSSTDAASAAQEWAERLQITQHLNAKLETLSKGNQQKVQVAAAVLHRPRLALLDEPFSGLDPLNQEMMLTVIRTLRDEGTTVLLSAHQLELVERLADRVFLLAKGRRVLDGTVQEVKAGVHGGYALRIRFAQPPEPDVIDRVCSQLNVVGFNPIDVSQWTFTLRDSAASMELLQTLGELQDILEYRGGSLSLHEIYLRALNPGTGTGDLRVAELSDASV